MIRKLFILNLTMAPEKQLSHPNKKNLFCQLTKEDFKASLISFAVAMATNFDVTET